MARGRNSVVTAAILGLVIVSCIIGGVYIRNAADRSGGPVVASATFKPMSVRAVEVAPKTVPLRLEARGYLKAFEEVTVHAEVDGQVRRRLVDEGHVVKKGQKLFELDTTFRNLTVKQLTAAVEQAREVQQQARAGMDVARAQVAEAEAAQQNAVNEYERIRKLHQRGHAVPIEVDRISTRKLQCEALMRQANGAMAAATSKKEAADAALSLTEAQLEEARERLKRCVIESPLDGVVSMVALEAGEYVRPTQPVCEVIRDDKFKLLVELSGSEVVLMRQGTRCTAIPDARSGMAFEGVVVRVGPRANPMSKKFPVELHVDNRRDCRLLAGMFCRCVLPAGQRDDVLVIPREAVIERFGGSYCYTVEPENHGLAARMLRIETRQLPGLAGQVEVLAGLEPGKRVVTSGVEQIRDGQSIQMESSIGLAAGPKRPETSTTP